MDTQVQLFNTRLSILSIPRTEYWLFAEGILRLLHDAASSDAHDTDSEYESETSSSSYTDNSPSRRQPSEEPELASPDEDEDEDDGKFLHVAFTPAEVTIICPSQTAEQMFSRALKTKESTAEKLPDSYLALQVGGDGLNIGKRVLELTQPLSEAGISIFFISNYFSDVVLIPENAKGEVVSALEQKGFTFSDISGSYMVDRSAPSSAASSRKPSCFDDDDLETKTFKVFETAKITPQVEQGVELLITGARSGSCSETLTQAAMALARFPMTGKGAFPDYFAVTRVSSQEVALLLPRSHRERSRLGFRSRSLVGSPSDVFIPVVIDLSQLPVDSKGIVAGVAARLIRSAEQAGQGEFFEMSYLSMARSGIVMVPRENGHFVNQTLSAK